MTNTTKRPPQKSAKSAIANSQTFSDSEKAAMRERALELRDSADGERVVLAAIAKMPEPDRSLAKQVHAIVKAAAPQLTPKTWYGMPAYADHAGKVVCFFQSAQKFKARYATFGFSDQARLDQGSMWPTSFALKTLTSAEEAKIAALVKKAAS